MNDGDQELAPALRRRFRTGRMCLDLTHTGGEGEYARWELIHEPSDAARYLGIVIGTEPPHLDGADLDSVLELRSAITALARSTVAGLPAPAAAIAIVNDAARTPPLVPHLVDGAATLLPGTAGQAASTLARDAIDLLGSPLVDRIRVCEADDCGLLFVDASRPGRRRWCSMQWCGDRAKKRSAGRPVPRGGSP